MPQPLAWHSCCTIARPRPLCPPWSLLRQKRSNAFDVEDTASPDASDAAGEEIEAAWDEFLAPAMEKEVLDGAKARADAAGRRLEVGVVPGDHSSALGPALERFFARVRADANSR